MAWNELAKLLTFNHHKSQMHLSQAASLRRGAVHCDTNRSLSLANALQVLGRVVCYHIVQFASCSHTCWDGARRIFELLSQHLDHGGIDEGSQHLGVGGGKQAGRCVLESNVGARLHHTGQLVASWIGFQTQPLPLHDAHDAVAHLEAKGDDEAGHAHCAGIDVCLHGGACARRASRLVGRQHLQEDAAARNHAHQHGLGAGGGHTLQRLCVLRR